MCTWLQLKVILLTPCLFQGFRMSHTYQQLRIFNILLAAGILIFSILKQDLEFQHPAYKFLNFQRCDGKILKTYKAKSCESTKIPGCLYNVYKLRLLFNQVKIDQIIRSDWTLL